MNDYNATTDDDLPGMWSFSDFEGGAPDEVRGPDWTPEPKHNDRASCRECAGAISFFEHAQGTGLGTVEVLDAWWAHDVHPADGHEARP